MLVLLPQGGRFSPNRYVVIGLNPDDCSGGAAGEPVERPLKLVSVTSTWTRRRVRFLRHLRRYSGGLERSIGASVETLSRRVRPSDPASPSFNVREVPMIFLMFHAR